MLTSKLNDLIKHGRLTLILPDGSRHDFGTEDGTLPVAVRLKRRSDILKIGINPDRYLGEAFMNGDLVMERGSIYDLLVLAGRNMEALPPTAPGMIRTAGYKLLAAYQQRNNQGRARRNVAHHYDLSDTLYRLFLDEDLQYSCAYFADPGMSLEEAQEAKKRHIAAKLLLAPGQKVLDIGCGWGGMAISLAQQADVSVLGVTLSEQQLAVARQRAEALGLGSRVRFELCDYRTLGGTFDRIVSVGMFEHVGTPQYGDYFDTVARLLAPDGVALVHAIGRNRGIARPNGWIDKYIFPGGYIPAFSEVILPLENSGLWMTDLEILRLHYAETLRHWRKRFLARKHELSALYDERFCRMWEFYLAASEASFRHNGFMVFQAQLAHKVGTVPLTRDYMVADERSSFARTAHAAE